MFLQVDTRQRVYNIHMVRLCTVPRVANLKLRAAGVETESLESTYEASHKANRTVVLPLRSSSLKVFWELTSIWNNS